MKPLTREASAHSGLQEARLARRRELVQAASEAFATLGYDLSNMLLIAESAGVMKATLYAHFGSKAKLFRAVIEYWLEELHRQAAWSCSVALWQSQVAEGPGAPHMWQ